jgi:hypothetical protein
VFAVLVCAGELVCARFCVSPMFMFATLGVCIVHVQVEWYCASLVLVQVLWIQ